MKIQLDADFQRRLRETFHDEGDGKFGIHREQDVEPVLDYAAAQRELQEGHRWGDGKMVATIPDTIVERMMRDPRIHPKDELAGIMSRGYKIIDEKRWKAWLNDSENSLFRTFKGEV